MPAAIPIIIAASVIGTGYSIYKGETASRTGPDIPIPKPITPAITNPQESAEAAGENAAIKEMERKRKRQGVQAMIATGPKGDESTAPVLKQTLGGT